MTKKQKVVFFLLLAAFLGTRFLLLLTHVEAASDLEELCRGTIAREILNGLKFPLWDYQADTYSGGSLVIGMLAAVFFKILGPSLFALKLAPLLLSFLCLLAVWCWVKKEWGTPAGLWAMAFLVFCPPVFAQVSLLAMGFHSEALLFAALAFLFFYRWLEKSEKKPLLLFGFAGGLGFWFCYTSVLAWAACFICFLRMKRGEKIRNLVLLAAGFAAGALIFIFYNLTHGLAGIKFLVRAFLPAEGSALTGFVPAFAQKFGVLIYQGIPLSLGLGAAGIFYALLAVSLGFAGRKGTGVLKPLLLSLLLFLVFYAASGFVFMPGSYIDYRYFVMFHFPALVFLGVSASRGRLAAVIGGILLITGLAGQARLWFKEPVGMALKHRGYSYYQMGWVWAPLLEKPEGREKVFAALKTYPEPEKFYLAWGISYAVQPEEAPQETLKRFLPETYGITAARGPGNQLPEPLLSVPRAREKFYDGLGKSIYFRGPEFLPEFLKSIAPGYEKYFYENLGGFFYVNGGLPQPGLDKQILAGDYGKDFVRGLGRETGSAWAYGRLDFEQAVRGIKTEVPELLAPSLFEGIGWGLRREIPEDRERALAWVRRLPPVWQEDAMKGLKACEEWYELPA